MAIIKCPECKEEVSDSAVSCPFCGYGVEAHIKKELEEKQAYEDFVNSHKPITFTENDWLLLFKVYDYALKRLKTTAKELPKFRNIYYNNGVPSLPLDFENKWWNCLCDTYIDICQAISTDLSKLSNPTVAKNARSATSVDVGNIIRPIMLRWDRLIMEPFEKNSPAILRNADHNYNVEVAENSSMGFGIITNSIMSMALYAVQSSMKEARAESQAFANKQAYINQSMSYMQQNVTKAWNENFDGFIADTELCHQVFLFEIGQVVFDGFLFTWKMIDDEFIKPENKAKYQKMIQELETKQKAAAASKHEALRIKREKYLKEEQEFVSKSRAEYNKINKQIEEIGFALFGEKARLKRELKEKSTQLWRSFYEREELLEATKRSTNFSNTSFTYTTYSYENLGKYEVRDRTTFNVIYDETKKVYVLYDSNGTKVSSNVWWLNRQVGAYKQFKATYSNLIISYGDNGAMDKYEVFLKLTNDF